MAGDVRHTICTISQTTHYTNYIPLIIDYRTIMLYCLYSHL
uniref:Uncharacterized protein n=1 Tax=Amphimedon queenslandica TaxID=400682 RepID=A0A1X7UW73_AMPQE